MRHALEHLGFTDTYHMDSVIGNPRDIDLWHQAFMAKFRGVGKPFEKADWDQLLGHCQVLHLHPHLSVTALKLAPCRLSVTSQPAPSSLSS